MNPKKRTVVVLARTKRDASRLGLSLEDLSNTVDVSPVIETINEEQDEFEELETKGLVSLGATIKDCDTFKSFDLLTKPEKQFYEKRMSHYLRDFELNKSSDMGVVHRIIMEEIYSERVYLQMLNNPTKDFSDQLTQCSVRYQKAMEALGANRDKRLRNRETHTYSIADPALNYANQGKAEYDKEINNKVEEEELLKSKTDQYFQSEVSRMVVEEDPDEAGN